MYEYFEILGPVMVGAVQLSHRRCGADRLHFPPTAGEPVKDATLGLYGSFWLTGSGHGTPLALIAGLCGMHRTTPGSPGFAVAKARGMRFRLEQAKLKNAHPNSVQLHLVGESGKVLDLIGQSLGDSIINIAEIDGLEANVSGDYPTLIVSNTDVPGMVAKISALLAQAKVNIAEMRLYRSGRGKRAAFIAECDQEIPAATIAAIRALEGIKKSQLSEFGGNAMPYHSIDEILRRCGIGHALLAGGTHHPGQGNPITGECRAGPNGPNGKGHGGLHHPVRPDSGDHRQNGRPKRRPAGGI